MHTIYTSHMGRASYFVCTMLVGLQPKLILVLFECLDVTSEIPFENNPEIYSHLKATRVLVLELDDAIFQTAFLLQKLLAGLCGHVQVTFQSFDNSVGH